MQTALLSPTTAALAMLLANAHAGSPGVTSLCLEKAINLKSPFQNGDNVDIQEDRAKPETLTRITVLDAKYWPWVCVRSAQGEVWVNFERVLAAKRAIALK